MQTTISYQKNRYSMGIWTGNALQGEYSEVDFFFSYKFSDRVQVRVWDLFASRDRASISDYEFFDLKNNTTNHLIDIRLQYVFNKKNGARIELSNMPWGRDRTQKGKQRYSSYAEITYPVRIANEKIQLIGGCNVFAHSLYAEKAGPVYFGSRLTKAIKVRSKHQIQLLSEVGYNVNAKNIKSQMKLEYRL